MITWPSNGRGVFFRTYCGRTESGACVPAKIPFARLPSVRKHLGAFEQHFSTSFSMSECFLCRIERIRRGDRDVQLALGDQPGAGLDGCLDFGGSANLWSFEPKATGRHLAEDDVRGIRHTRLLAHEGIEHQSASTAQAARKRHHRFPADAVER